VSPPAVGDIHKLAGIFMERERNIPPFGCSLTYPSTFYLYLSAK